MKYTWRISALWLAANRGECARYLSYKIIWATSIVQPSSLPAITSSLEKNKLPTHIRLSDTELGRESIILMEQIRTIDKSRLVKYMGSVGEDIMEQVDGALKISLGFKERP